MACGSRPTVGCVREDLDAVGQLGPGVRVEIHGHVGLVGHERGEAAADLVDPPGQAEVAVQPPPVPDVAVGAGQSEGHAEDFGGDAERERNIGHRETLHLLHVRVDRGPRQRHKLGGLVEDGDALGPAVGGHPTLLQRVGLVLGDVRLRHLQVAVRHTRAERPSEVLVDHVGGHERLRVQVEHAHSAARHRIDRGVRVTQDQQLMPAAAQVEAAVVVDVLGLLVVLGRVAPPPAGVVVPRERVVRQEFHGAGLGLPVTPGFVGDVAHAVPQGFAYPFAVERGPGQATVVRDA